MGLRYKKDKILHLFIALTVSSVIAYIKYTLVKRTTDLVVDAQAGVIILFGLITSILLLFLLTLSIYNFQRARVNKDILKGKWFFIVSMILIAISGYSMMDSLSVKRALLDSADPKTEPMRLRDLVGYQSGFGYEVDNRVASNPSTPVDVLESLYEIQGQIGTDMSLATNPNTPNYILIALSMRRDESWRQYIIQSLERNPKVIKKELFFDEEMILRETKSFKGAGDSK